MIASNHPTGEAAPRTLVDAAGADGAFDREVAARLRRMEEGRHPPLAELGNAFGGGLALEVATGDLRSALRELQGDATDEALAGALDRAYRRLAPGRTLRVEVTAGGLAAPDAPSPLRATTEERVRLFVLADNRTDAGVEFSLESHGEGIGGHLEPLRSGSTIFDLGPLPAGRYLLPVLVVAAGAPLTIDLAVECEP